jgi:hypothetical protein
MRLDTDTAMERLAAHDHGILCTVHPVRGVDAVPSVYALDHDGRLGVPIDRVKPKRSSTLQRERNLRADARAALLIERWDRDDWSRLWWVRAELVWQGDESAPEGESSLAEALAVRYAQYRDRPFERVLVFRVQGVSGWAGAV